MLSDFMGHRERTICSNTVLPRLTAQLPFPGSSLDQHSGHRAGGTAVSVVTGLVLGGPTLTMTPKSMGCSQQLLPAPPVLFSSAWE